MALLGSILMFAGWVLAIVPAFHHFHRIAIIVIVAVIGFGVVLIPSGLDILGMPRDAGEKRGTVTLLVSMLPAAVLFVITVVVLPLAPVYRILAIVAEVVGMVAFAWAWRASMSRAA